MDEHAIPPPDPPSTAPCRVSIQHLAPFQVDLLRRVLRAGDVPFGIHRGDVVAAAEHTDEIERAVAWAGVDSTARGEQLGDPGPAHAGGSDDEPDDPLRPRKRPLVKPPRPPVRDGRHQATRWRRFAAGLVDEAVVGAPVLLANEAGAPPWATAALHATYHIAPTVLFGWTIGKLWCGTRVVDVHRLRRPGIRRATVRWAVAAVPLLLALFAGVDGNWTTVLVVAVHGPIMVDLRGTHDYAAGTIVVERSAAGPGVWVRSGRRAPATGPR